MPTPDSRPRSLILLSDKSSGSTAFQYETLKHPDVWAVPFTQHNDHETLFWVKAAVLLGRPTAEFYGGRRPFSRVVARRGLRELVKQNAPSEYRPVATDEQLVFEGFRAITKRRPGVFFEKSPHHLAHWGAMALLADYVARYGDDVRVILLTRNPLAVSYSAFNRWYSAPDERQHRWAQCYRNYLCFRELVPEVPFLELRYEDFVAEPVRTMAQVAEFAGLESDVQMGTGVHARSLDAWAGDDSFTLTLDPAVARLAGRLGYPPDELTNDASGPGRRVSPLEVFEFRARSAYSRLVRRHLRPALVAMGLKEP